MSATPNAEAFCQPHGTELDNFERRQCSESAIHQIKDIHSIAVQEYERNNPISQSLHQEAIEVLPGGNTRSVLHAEPFPICMERGEGNRLVDVDKHGYLDLVGEMTAGLYGHSHHQIRDAIISTITQTGLNLGATTSMEAHFAKEIRRRFPSMEQMRFCNSGTEANLYALSIARYATGLSKIIVFRGGYHGGVLSFIHGIADNNVDRDDWILGTYNDAEGAQKLIFDHKGIAAAVLVEGMQGAGGCIPAAANFLLAIQNATRAHGMLFILDEVMTSRLAPGGIQSTILDPNGSQALKPDITALGKWLAGGMSIGCFGGRKELMSVYDPRHSTVSDAPTQKTHISHSGTFNNNSLAMNVGFVSLSSIYTTQACIDLNAMGEWFRQELIKRCSRTKMSVTGMGSVCNVHFTSYEGKITCVEDLEVGETETESMLRDIFWFFAIRKGYWIARRGMLSLIIGTSREELQSFLNMVEEFVQKFGHLIK
ncbi:glutamate-1-semialdehyde 2-1-aminomutase [Penicillium cf. viridicatum]|uniref:Glutamate-1-semialdehyde 2-1-aminomutase n=1 Tax=Penicillium cf. viridicatum TaxID=2972119 RepID=A0A9W9JJD1_9EURO|nr:glutamate-1-semialdehyde 2-1-aminomutase [Penicillium cf. viridicatum]